MAFMGALLGNLLPSLLMSGMGVKSISKGRKRKGGALYPVGGARHHYGGALYPVGGKLGKRKVRKHKK